ncbi:unnamed protein product [Linum trigynum]|uniref:Uncharacterized protein n=1 Tax=Linum trigynum TaxID=586398 RepID=A0AAV2FAK4_9ROSI
MVSRWGPVVVGRLAATKLAEVRMAHARVSKVMVGVARGERRGESSPHASIAIVAAFLLPPLSDTRLLLSLSVSLGASLTFFIATTTVSVERGGEVKRQFVRKEGMS